VDVLNGFEDREDAICLAEAGGRLEPTKLAAVIKYKANIDELVFLRNLHHSVSLDCTLRNQISKELFAKEYDDLGALHKRKWNIGRFLDAMGVKN
jgi:hypothetical protein